MTEENTLERHELHAACEAIVTEGDHLLSWIDLDLDVILEDATVKVLDEATFMEHADTMQLSRASRASRMERDRRPDTSFREP